MERRKSVAYPPRPGLMVSAAPAQRRHSVPSKKHGSTQSKFRFPGGVVASVMDMDELCETGTEGTSSCPVTPSDGGTMSMASPCGRKPSVKSPVHLLTVDRAFENYSRI